MRAGARTRILDNVAYGNSNGMFASFNGAWADRSVIEGNRVFDNGVGIQGNYDAEIRDNESWGNTSLWHLVYYGAQAHDNASWGNATGLFAYSGGMLYDNRVWANTTGITLQYGNEAYGNRVYGNSGVGIHVRQWDNWVHNNVVQANGGVGILVDGAYYSSLGTRIENNTVVGTVADAVAVQGNSRDIRIRNNILEQRGVGYALNVASNSQQGFVSDYNLFMLGASARLGYWEERPFANRTDWFYEIGQDASSVSADARFVDVDGADDVVGWDGGVVAGSVRIVDDGDPTFATTGSWTTTAVATARDGDIRTATAGDGSSEASWTFDGLVPGYYRVSATWPYLANYSGDATFRVYDGDTVVGSDEVSQNYHASAGFTDAGSIWENLALVRISGAGLTVKLDNLANGQVIADAVRIERLEGDFGLDDDLHLLGDSPAIDRGDPNSRSLGEPRPNGNRVDLGAYGNTAQANASPEPMVQVLGPNGLEKIEVGVPVTVSWRSAGLLPYDSVLRLNAGQENNANVDNWLGQQTGERTDAYTGYYSSIAAATAVDMSALPAGTPEAMVRSYAYAPGGTGYQLTYQLGAPDGAYQAVLYFVEPSNIALGARKFDIVANGVVIATDVDVRALAGNVINKAVAITLDLNVTGGQGLKLEFVNKSASYSALVSGIELRRANANGVANPVLSLQASTDDGASWTTVATGLTLDAYGNGQTQWTPDTETVGNTARLRVVATINPPSGAVTVSDVSDEGFLIANAGNKYYVNDGSLAGDEYTTAVGNNANSGKDPSRPMASLAALLRAYDLDAGDIIHVDSGTYSLVTNIVLGAQDSGVVIQGAQQPGHASVLDRGNTNAGQVAIELQGADDVTLQALQMTGGLQGVFANTGVDSDRLSIIDSRVYGNAQWGVHADTGNDNLLVSGNLIEYNGSGGVYARGVDALIEGNEVARNNGWGVDASGARTRLLDNVVYGNSNGMYTSFNGAWADRSVIEGNRVFDNGVGIQGNYDAEIRDNESWGNTSYGVVVYYGAQAHDNASWGNATGLFAYSGGMLYDNRVWANTTGITVQYGNEAYGNRVYGNSGVGIRVEQWDNWVHNNVVQANGGVGILVDGAYYSSVGTRIENNTVVGTVADAVAVQGNSRDIRIRNNILEQRGVGYALNVASNSQQGFVSDYNLFMLGASARLGYWEERPFANRTDWFYEIGQDASSVSADARFVDVDGADDVVGWDGSVVAGSVRIVDDGDPTFATTGSWTTTAVATARDGDIRTATAGDGSSEASWTFDGLVPGYYRVSATWPYLANYSGDATFRVYDGDTVVGSDEVSQNYHASAGFTDAGSIWENLALVRISGASLTVKLDNLANGQVIADAVRIERLEGDFGLDDDLHLRGDSPAIDRRGPEQPQPGRAAPERQPGGSGRVRQYSAGQCEPGTDGAGAGPQRAGEARGRGTGDSELAQRRIVAL